MIKQKIRIDFTKRGDLRFISHRDVMRLLEHAVRRSGLPVRMTEGFNPHPRIVVPHSLALGIASEAETAEIELSRWVNIQEITPCLQEFLPEEMEIRSVSLLKPVRRSSVLTEITYTVTLPGELRDLLNPDKVLAFLDQSTIPYVRRAHKKKDENINLRPFITGMEMIDNGIRMTLAVTSGRTVKPDEVLAALGRWAEVEIPEFPRITKIGTKLREPR